MQFHYGTYFEVQNSIRHKVCNCKSQFIYWLLIV